jgi:hypothetical protein
MKQKQKKLITEIMNEDANDGLYKKQTAVEWLAEKIYHEGLDDDFVKQAKQMEQDQLLAKYGEGYEEGLYDGINKYSFIIFRLVCYIIVKAFSA